MQCFIQLLCVSFLFLCNVHGMSEESPLHQLIFGSVFNQKIRLEEAVRSIDSGVSLDIQTHSQTWGTMTFVQQLKVKIKNDQSSTFFDAEKTRQQDIQLLDHVQKAVENRKEKVLALLTEPSRLSPDPARIVVAYFVDQETFTYDDKEIEKRAKDVLAKQEENERLADMDNFFGW